METFLTEFTALQSDHAALLSIVSSLPQLCLSLNPSGVLTAYNQDPSAFLGPTLTALTSLPYTRWFLDPSQGSRGSAIGSRNLHFIHSIDLAFQSKSVVREEHLMFMGGRGGKATPISLTVIPVLHGQSMSTSFDERFLGDAADDASSDAPQPDASSPLTDDGTSITAHAFHGDEGEMKAARERIRAEERSAREAARSVEVARVVLMIENKEVSYRLSQHTKRIKEMLKASSDRRRSSAQVDEGEGAEHVTGPASIRRSVQMMAPKLDTGVSSALTLMQTLARQERNGAKRRMYAEIIHMLSHSKGMESVNDEVITQIEQDNDVGKELKSWLINQINPTNQGVDERLDDIEKEKEKEREKGQPSVTLPPDPAEGSEEGKVGSEDAGEGQVAHASAARRSMHAKKMSAVVSRESSLTGQGPASVRGSVMRASVVGVVMESGVSGEEEAEEEMPRGMSMQNSDAQFIDPSPDISLVKRVGSSKAGSHSSRTPSIPGTDAGGHAGAGSAVPTSGRRKTLKERKSLVDKEKRDRAHAAEAAKLPPTTAALTSMAGSGPSFAPVRPALQLPLQAAPNDRRVMVERPADSRVRYNHWTGALQGVDHGQEKDREGEERSAPASSTIAERKAEVDAQTDGPDASSSVIPGDTVVVKDSVFTVVGCHPPEVHANAALDVNAQTLFWSSSIRPKTVDPSSYRKHSLLHSPIYLTPAAESSLAVSLSQLSVWNQFNIFHVSARSQGWPLTFTFTTIVTQLNLMGKWGLDATLVSNFIREVERGYFAIPYHSSTHAADVLHHSYHMITQTHLGISLSDLEMFILLVAATVHDYGHPGVSNQYLTTTFSPLALQYNDKNVLESYHIASIFLLMQAKPECNIFQYMDLTTYRKARKMLIDLVLATDLASHFDILAVWKRKESIIDLSKDEDKLLVMQMILKSGDLGHPSRVRHLHLTWSELVTEEFFMQGDREKKNGMNVSAMMDRSTCNIVTSQIGFISFLVQPIFSAFQAYVNTDMYAMLVRANLAMWERLNLESEELRRAKEEEEEELRRLAQEREELEAQKMSEQRQKLRLEQLQAEAFENDIRTAAAKEAEKEQAALEEEKQRAVERAKGAELTAAQRLLEAELARDQEADEAGQLSRSSIVDVRLRRENDNDWPMSDLSEADSEEEVEEEAADEAEEAERQRRRDKRARQSLAERQEERQRKRRERSEHRKKEVEDEQLREVEGEREEREREERRKREEEERWTNSTERIEQEIDQRIQRQSLILQSRSRGRSRGVDEDGAEREVDPDAALAPLQRAVEAESSGAATQKVTAEAPDAPWYGMVPEDDAEVEVEVAAAVAAVSAPPPPLASPTPTPTSPSLSVRLQRSIELDRERVEAQRERARAKAVRERSKLLSVEERAAVEEVAALEERVRLLLREEQAAARAEAERAEMEQLQAEAADASTHTAVAAEAAKRKRTAAVVGARERGRSEATREVSMLLMDKEWGKKKPVAEERRVWLAYLHFAEHHHGDQAKERRKEDAQPKTGTRAEAAAPARAGARAAVPLVTAEEWVDEAETQGSRAQGKAAGRSALSASAHGASDLSGADSADELSRRGRLSGEGKAISGGSEVDSDAEPRFTSPFSSLRQRGGSQRRDARRRLSRVPEEVPRRLQQTVEGQAESEEEAGEGTRARVEVEERESKDRAAARARLGPSQRSGSRERRPSNAQQVERRDSKLALADSGQRRRLRPHVTFMEEKERATPVTPSTRRPRQSTVAAAQPRSWDEEDTESETEGEELRVELEMQRVGEEEKETLTPHSQPQPQLASIAEERQRRLDKQRALRAQQRRADAEEADERRPSLPSAAPASAPSSSPDPTSPSTSSTPIHAAFTSFPPLALPHLLPTPVSSSAPLPISSPYSFSAPLELLLPSFTSSPFHSRSLVPSKPARGSGDAEGMVGDGGAELKGSDWRAADDEEAMAAILRRVIPRSRQAEIERARRAIIAKHRVRP